MRYVMGIHLGRTRTTAAVCRSDGGPWGGPEVVPLWGGVPWIDTVLHISHGGELSAGQTAVRHAAVAPDRIVRAPHRRTGDDVPFVLGDLSYTAEALAAALIGLVADRVADIEGVHAERIVVTHPPSWSGYRRGLLHDALDNADLPGVLALPSPIAAAESHLANERVDVGSLLAVCRIGGEQVETALLRQGPRGFDLLSHTEGGEHEAGARMDDLIVGHVLRQVSRDKNDAVAMASLRAACTMAKERLSTAREVVVADDARLTRAELETLIRPVLQAGIGQLARTAANATTGDIAAAVLVGGSAAIPLFAQLARTVLDCPVFVDANPGTAMARGAALAARPRPEPREEVGNSLVASNHELPAVYGQRDEADEEPPPERPPVEITPLTPPKRKFSFSRKATAAAHRDEDR
ncbi:molecular chaperone [Prauserella marina]|uniref:Hsp70 protein n=2 Tax=Prauserella marina TaxID=530584 RepID=A0A222VX13_9PSEU|nr:Hsp70 family protein [Prauserella marina]ASR38479.1 molecular chaperone [Prauserella marina]PWV78276.1 Hsp70 protein [Prauserella marina]SDC82404.1 Hsp70 protein [Prauserella marina]